MNNILKTVALLLLISLTSCEKETNQAVEGLPPAPFSNKKYTVDELPNDIKDFYYQLTDQNSNKAEQITDNTIDAIFSENSIVGNTDQQNNSNYSVGYVFDDTPENIIYNLVINKDSTGTIVGKKFKYICNPSDYNNFRTHNFDFKYFVGVTEVSTFSTNNSGRGAFNKSGDDLPCPVVLPSPTGSLGGGGSSSNNTGFNTTVLGYNTSAGTGNFSATFGGTTYYSGGGTSGSGASGGGSFNCTSHDYCIPNGYGGYNYSCGDLRPSHNHNKSGDPCNTNTLPSGIVPINLVPYYLQNIKLVIPFNRYQSLFLANNDAVVHQLWYVIDFSPAALTPEYKQFWIDLVEKMRNDSTLYPTITPFLIEKYIDDSQLDPCSKGVFQQVKNTTNCDFANVLAKLGAKNTYYNTTMISAVPPSRKPAQTVRNSAFNYTIYISTDYTSKTKLFIAASMLHELVHAYFMSLFDDFNKGRPNNPNAYNDFAILFQKFVDKTYPGSGDAAHHEQMATDYVNAIAAALQEYQPGLPQQVYKDLAWGGLQEAPVFNTLYPVGSVERQRIINRYSSEQTGHPIGQGTPNEQFPSGQPCN